MLSHWRFIRAEKILSACIIGSSLVFLVLSLCQPVLVAKVFASLEVRHFNYWEIVLLVSIFLLSTALSMILAYLNEKFSEKTVLSIRREIFSRIFTLKGIEEEPTKVAAIVVNDSTLFANGVSAVISSLPVAFLSLIIAFFLCLFILPWAFLISLAFSLIAVIFTLIFAPKIRDKRIDVQEYTAQTLSRVQELYGVSRLIRQYQVEDFFIQKLRDTARMLYEKSVDMAKFQAVVGPMIDFIVKSASGVALLSALVYYVLGYADLASVVSFMLYFQIVTSSLQEILETFVTVQEASAGRERIHLLSHKTSNNQISKEVTKGFVGDETAIEFNNVSFSYGDQRVLTDVSFTIPASGITVIVGLSGAGKTTILNLMLEELAPASGCISRDDKIAVMGLVDQESSIVSGTIADNVRFGREDISDEKIVWALRKVGLNQFASPEKINQHLSALFTISGGERQRLCLARAYVGAVSLLVLDEPTSNVDGMLENLMVEALQELGERIPIVIVTHRISTALHAKRLIHLQKGRVIAEGDPYRCLEESDYLRQMLGECHIESSS